MSITIRIPEHLRYKTEDEHSIEVIGGTVQECLAELVRRYPILKGEILDSEGTIQLKWVMCINDKIVSSPDELSHPVANGDIITLVSLIAGG